MVATLTFSSDVMSEQLRKRFQIPHSHVVAVWVHVGPAFQQSGTECSLNGGEHRS